MKYIFPLVFNKIGQIRQHLYSLLIEIGPPNGYLLAEWPLSMLTKGLNGA
jgi:hypothetical protein